MLGMYFTCRYFTFPKDFSQVATFQGYFPKWQLYKCAIHHFPCHLLLSISILSICRLKSSKGVRSKDSKPRSKLENLKPVLRSPSSSKFSAWTKYIISFVFFWLLNNMRTRIRWRLFDSIVMTLIVHWTGDTALFTDSFNLILYSIN